MFIFRCKKKLYKYQRFTHIRHLAVVALLYQERELTNKISNIKYIMASFFTLNNDGANGKQLTLADLGAPAANWTPYVPFMLRNHHRGDNSNCCYSPLAPSSLPASSTTSVKVCFKNHFF